MTIGIIIGIIIGLGAGIALSYTLLKGALTKSSQHLQKEAEILIKKATCLRLVTHYLFLGFRLL